MDAHKFLLNHFKNFDFIWSSPPCPSHSRLRKMSVLSNSKITGNINRKAIYPDMKLYEEIILLKHYFKGKWTVENVASYYEPLIKPQIVQRHYIWANFNITHLKLKRGNIAKKHDTEIAKYYGINDLKRYKLTTPEKDQILRSCVHPKIGLHILNCARKQEQKTLKIS